MKWFRRSRETFTFSRHMSDEEVEKVSERMDTAFKRMGEAFKAMDEAFDLAFQAKKND